MDKAWEKLIQKFPQIQLIYPLKSETTLKIGGKAKGFVEVKESEKLIVLIKDCHKLSIPHLVIGGGSNLLVSDQGYQGLVIKINFSGLKENNGVITVLAGTSLQELVDYTIEQGLDGMSTMTGIPGMVGGAIFGSAGAYGDNIRDHLSEVSYFDGEEVKELDKDEYSTGYRDSLFKSHRELVILEAKFSDFSKTDPQQLREEVDEIIKKRLEKYPADTKCPGSFFKNIPIGDLTEEQIEKVRKAFNDFGKDPDKLLRFGKVPAGPLLEVVGANGDQLGDIKIAQNHGNTFFNLGDGTAEDFYNLAKKWKNVIKEKFGVDLEPEVQLINLPPL